MMELVHAQTFFHLRPPEANHSLKLCNIHNLILPWCMKAGLLYLLVALPLTVMGDILFQTLGEGV